MAILYPNSLPDGAPASEISTFRSLAQLDESWRVFHSVVWQSARRGRQADGEADFVLLHPHHGLIVLEVKGGRVEVTDGEWFSVDRHGVRHQIRNPFLQVTDSKHSLNRHLRDRHPSLPDIPFGHAVLFPDVTIDDRIGLFGPRELIIDRQDLQVGPTAVDRLIRHWGMRCALTRDETIKIVNEIAPTVTLRTRVRDVIDASEQRLFQLTETQIAVFRQLRRIRRVLVLGGAGTGKTVLALERARQLAQEHRTLLVCYNEPLARHLARAAGTDSNLTVSTFHSLCFQAARRVLGTAPVQPHEDWWENTAAEILSRDATENGARLGALVVDEAQDFAESWMTALLLLLEDPDQSPCYLFADTHQHIYRATAGFPTGFAEFSLDINCRNTLPIAERVAKIFDDPAPTQGAEGKAPSFVLVAGIAEIVETVQDIIHQLLVDEGVSPNRIVVLTNDPAIRERLRTLMAGDAPFVALDEHGVIVESIARFKGLEAEVVLLALTDAILRDGTSLKAQAYVGLSRARSLLIVVGSKAIRRSLQWPASL